MFTEYFTKDDKNYIVAEKLERIFIGKYISVFRAEVNLIEKMIDLIKSNQHLCQSDSMINTTISTIELIHKKLIENNISRAAIPKGRKNNPVAGWIVKFPIPAALLASPDNNVIPKYSLRLGKNLVADPPII